MRSVLALFISSIFLLVGCSVSHNYEPDKKYPPDKLRSDYTLFRNILEAKHPALYWYTSKDSMDFYFDKGYKDIADSMTELQFGWQIIAPLLHNIHCGHTSFNMSKNWFHYLRNKHIPSFPLFLKAWNDSLVVSGNLNKKDSILKKGMVITAINNVPSASIIHHISQYLSQDGYENNINNLRLSTGFPFYHRNVYGLYQNYSVNYIDSSGNNKKITVPFFNPLGDTVKKHKDSLIAMITFPLPRKLTRKQKLHNLRSLEIDKANSIATIDLYTFSRARLKKFFRHSFKEIRNKKISNLIIDIRGNGGGDISNFVALTKYIRNTPFRVSDTSVAASRSLAPYTKYIHSGFFTNIGLRFLTRRSNNLYHFRYWEKHKFAPKHIAHFNSDVYVITNGFTFSASSLFCNAVKGQSNVTLVGENTGGGWYGNSGIFIPDIILPQTKLRVRLPLFKIVQFNHVAEKGTGVLPDVRVEPTIGSVVNNTDLKIIKVRELIQQKNSEKIGAIQPANAHQAIQH